MSKCDAERLPTILAFLALLVATLSGCYQWTPVTVPVSSEGLAVLFETDPPDRVRIHRVDGSVMEIADPRLENDSIVRSTLPREGVPLSDVYTLNVRQVDDGKVVQGTLGIVAGAALVGYVVGLCSEGLC